MKPLLNHSHYTKPLISRAFSLVEVTMALGVASFALLVILGLLPVGLATSQRAVNATEATLIANHVMQDLVAAAENGSTPLVSETYGIPVAKGESTLFLSREGNPAPETSAVFKAIVTVGDPVSSGLSGNTHYAPASFSRIKVMWPAPADEADAAGSVTTPFTLRF